MKIGGGELIILTSVVEGPGGWALAVFHFMIEAMWVLRSFDVQRALRRTLTANWSTSRLWIVLCWSVVYGMVSHLLRERIHHGFDVAVFGSIFIDATFCHFESTLSFHRVNHISFHLTFSIFSICWFHSIDFHLSNHIQLINNWKSGYDDL